MFENFSQLILLKSTDIYAFLYRALNSFPFIPIYIVG